MRKQAWVWGIANILVSITAVAAAYMIVMHHQAIKDWWTLRNYAPSPEVARLADETTMIGAGRDAFYASDPQIEDRQAFSQRCANVRGENTIVLGCYSGQRIYLYNVTDPRLDGVKQVTAAHEMLHAAYERLDDTTKTQVNAWVEAQAASMNDERLRSLIAMYEKQEPGHRLNELHSILGTEYANLLPELESYYKRYFSDRSRVVAFANKYAATFNESQARIRSLQTQLDAYKREIDALNVQLNQQKARLDERTEEMNALRRSDPDAYNQQVPSYNAQAREYNDNVARMRELVNKYNELVVVHNNEAASQSDLYHSLDSRYQAVSH